MVEDILKKKFLKRLFNEFLISRINIILFSSKEIKVEMSICSAKVIFINKNNSIDYDFNTNNDFIYNKVYSFYKKNRNKLATIFYEYQKELFNKGL